MTSEQAKAVADAMITLMEGELPATYQVIAAVKEEGRGYKPDPKSRTAWELATHLATADVWLLDSTAKGNFHFDPEAAKQQAAQFTSAAGIVEFYKKEVTAKLNVLRGLSGERLAQITDFYGFIKMPTASFIGFVNNHSMHHRGQLAAYLRALGSKVPNIYGPSADAEK
jgi:uncharacterized damage-inducible protein DinB